MLRNLIWVLRSRTCEFSRGGYISEGDAEVSKVLVGTVVDRGQVLPLLHRAGKVNLARMDMTWVLARCLLLVTWFRGSWNSPVWSEEENLTKDSCEQSLIDIFGSPP